MIDPPSSDSRITGPGAQPEAEELVFDVVDDGRGAGEIPAGGDAVIPDADSLRQAARSMLLEKTKRYIISTLLVGGGLYWLSVEETSTRWIFICWCIWSFLKGALLAFTWKLTSALGRNFGVNGIFFGIRK